MATPSVTRTSISRLEVHEVCSFLKEKVPIIKDDTIAKFQDELINGTALLELNTDDLKELTGTMGKRKSIEKLLKNLL